MKSRRYGKYLRFLAMFQPGVQVNPHSNGSPSGADYSVAHVNGLRQGSNINTLDGIDVNDSVAPRMGLSLTANNTDSVEEACLVTDGAKAEYGRGAGAQVRLVTRSGSDQFHGNGFDYLCNSDLNANDFFNNSAGVSISTRFTQHEDCLVAVTKIRLRKGTL